MHDSRDAPGVAELDDRVAAGRPGASWHQALVGSPTLLELSALSLLVLGETGGEAPAAGSRELTHVFASHRRTHVFSSRSTSRGRDTAASRPWRALDVAVGVLAVVTDAQHADDECESLRPEARSSPRITAW